MISAIVPIFNSAAYLQNCIKSILTQTFTDLEIICVNDGSTDDSLQILEEMARQDTRIKVLSQENAGVSAARNAGLEVALGEYITFVDSDDELEPDMYEVLLNLAKKHHADIAHCGYRKIHFDGTLKDVCGTGELLIQNAEEATKYLLAGERFVSGLWNKMYRSELVTDVRFDPALKINEDVLFNVQVFQKAKTIAFYDVPKYHYFERENSACSRTALIRKKQDAVNAAEQILEICRDSSVESVAAGRLYYCLLDLYRAYIFDGIRKNHAACAKLHELACKTAALCQRDARHSHMNYVFMRKLPVIYKAVYSIYDRIRKPNWDL